ncbi:MAG: carbohydrate ABC transporter substrate-binding protein [Lachnospiraceae bacterium]|nr:carbohydrate ABC transporter substrate-binding protein [Lachnospiraceae bacterium]
MKLKIRRIIATAVLITMSVTATAGCGKTAGDKPFEPGLDTSVSTSVTVYGNYSNFEALESEFERFNEYYPNVNLSYIYLDGFYNAIGTTLLSNEAPDIYCTFYWMWGDPKCSDIFDAAANLADPETGIDFSCVRQSLLRKTDSGEILMAPVLATSFGMLVNSDLFKKEGLKVPTTWSEFENVCAKFKEAGYASPVMGYVSSGSNSLEYNFAYPSLVNAVSAHPEMQDSFNNLDPAAGELMRSSLEKIKQLADADCVNIEKCVNEIEDNYNAAIMRFYEGDVPMLICSADVASGTKKRETQSESFSASPFEYRFYPVPFDEKGGFVIDTVAMNFSVNKNSPNKDMAIEFMRFLVSTKELGNMASVKRLITTAQNLSLDNIYSSLSDTRKDRIICSTEANINDNAVKQFRYACHHVLVGNMTVDEAIAAYGNLSK